MAFPRTIYISEKTPHGPHEVDIYSRLMDDQIIFLAGEFNDEMAEVIISQSLGGAQRQPSDIAIQAKKTARVKKHLNGVVLYHTGQPMEVIIVKNHLFGTDKLTDATTECRYDELGFRESHRDRINNSHKAMVLNYKKYTDRDLYLSAEEAVEYGLIDRIMRVGEKGSQSHESDRE